MSRENYQKNNNKLIIDKMNIKNTNNFSNSKKVLCFNVLANKVCNYGSKCMYAHNLNEQKIEPMRHKIYTILKSSNDLSNIDLINDNKLYSGLLQMTKVCSFCMKKICPGGYNCRNGSINIKYKICFDDLQNGNCIKTNCMSVHLTSRGLVPYFVQKNKLFKLKNQIAEEKKLELPLEIDETSSSSEKNIRNSVWENIPRSIFKSDKKRYGENNYSPPKTFDNKTKKLRPEKDKNKNIEASRILLTDKFFTNYYDKKINYDYMSSDSDDENDVENIISYLNNSSDTDSLEESIFS